MLNKKAIVRQLKNLDLCEWASFETESDDCTAVRTDDGFSVIHNGEEVECKKAGWAAKIILENLGIIETTYPS